MAFRIDFTKHPDKQNLIKISPASFLSDHFNMYREICTSNGARYDAKYKCNVSKIENIPKIVNELANSGFTCGLIPEIQVELQRISVEKNSELVKADANLEEIENKLKQKGLNLFPHQREGVMWLVQRQKSLLLDDMGLGKTIQILAQLPNDAAVLVVCPKAAKSVWIAECRKWRPDLIPSVISGRDNFRWPNNGEMVIINYSILQDNLPVLDKKVQLVGDEVQALTNYKAKQTERFSLITKAVLEKDGRAIGLTGTPLRNRPPELWSLLNCFDLHNDCFGSWKNFVSMFDGVKGNYGYEWGTNIDTEAVVKCLNKVSLQRKKKDVLKGLPEKIHRFIEVDINDVTRKYLDESLNILKSEGKWKDKIDFENDEEVEKEKTSIPFEMLSSMRRQLAAAKIPAMIEIVEQYEENEEPLIVFSAHREPIDTLQSREGWRVITGDTKDEDRGKIVELFQAGKLKGVGITIKAGGVALTLTRASNELFVDRAWTPSDNLQAEDRAYRIGQTRGVNIGIMQANHPIDKRVSELLDYKTVIIKKSVDAATKATVDQVPEIKNILQVEIDAMNSKTISKVDDNRRLESLTDKPTEVSRGVVSVLDDNEKKLTNKLRGPKDEIEEHAARSLVTLADLDPDNAREINGVGFNKVDGQFGKSLANFWISRKLFSEKQWQAAVKMVVKYSRQVGKPTIKDKNEI